MNWTTATVTEKFISSNQFYLNFSRVDFAYYSKDRGLDVYLRGREEPINFKDGAEELWQLMRGIIKGDQPGKA